MATGQELQLLVNINALFSGQGNFTKAAGALSTLQKNTKSFQDTVQKISGYQKAQTSLEKLRAAHENTSAEYAAMPAKITEAKNKAAELKTQYDAQRISLQNKNASMLQSQAAYSQQAEKVSQLSRQIKETPTGENRKALTAQLEAERAKLSVLSKTYRDSTKDYKQQEQKVKSLSKEYKQAQAETKRLEDNEKKLSERVSSSAQALEKQENNFRQISQGINQAGISVNNFIAQQDNLNAAFERSQAASEKLKNIKENLTWDSINSKAVMPAAKLYATVQPLIKLSGDFEAAMARVKAVGFSGANADLSQFEALKAQAAQLGAQTQFTSIQAAQSMENLMRAGLKTQEVMQAMPALLDMAAAEGMDLAQGASIMAGALKGFEGKRSSSQIADMLAYTSANSATSIANLGEAVKVSASTASKLNIKPEQLFSYLGALANRQVEGSQAGSTITNALVRLSREENQKKLWQMGISTRTKSGEMVELPEIMRQFAEKTKNLSELEQIEKLSDIFGTGYGKYMVGFMSEVVNNAQKELQAGLFNNANDSAKRMANINLDTLNGQLTILSSAWDGFRTQIGDIFAPLMRSGVEALSSALSKISAIMKDFPMLSRGVVISLGAIAGYRTISGIASIAKSFLQLPGAFLEVVNAGRNVQNVLASVSVGANNTGGVISAMANNAKNIFMALSSPITNTFALIKSAAFSSFGAILAHPFIAGVALIGGVILLAKNWDKVKEKLSAVCDFCREKWQVLTDWWSSWTFPDIWAGLKNSFVETLGQIKIMWEDICAFFASLNPFKNRGSEINVQARAEARKKIDTWDPLSGNLPGFAKGGIFTRPHVGVFAEDGPEAIIPLSDKSRGVPLLMQAAQSLGVTRESPIPSVNNSSVNNNNSAPVINITVNNSGESDNNLAEKIAQSVRQAWEELQSRQERLSFA